MTSLTQAIAWLGLNQVAATALGLSIQSGAFNCQGDERQVRDVGAHAIAMGFYAKTLAGLIGQNQGMVFLCGLLYSIGKFFVVHTGNHVRFSSGPPPSLSPHAGSPSPRLY